MPWNFRTGDYSRPQPQAQARPQSQFLTDVVAAARQGAPQTLQQYPGLYNDPRVLAMMRSGLPANAFRTDVSPTLAANPQLAMDPRVQQMVRTGQSAMSLQRSPLDWLTNLSRQWSQNPRGNPFQALGALARMPGMRSQDIGLAWRMGQPGYGMGATA